MKRIKAMTTALLVAIGSAGCSTEVTAPNIQDPNGPKAEVVTISYCVDISTIGSSVVCYPNATLAVGNSAQLSARATNGDEDLTSQCAWIWSANNKAVSIRVSQPSRTAIVTKNPFNISGGLITVTATCNGVTGSYNIL